MKIKLITLISIVALIVSCNKPNTYIKNDAIKAQIDTFINKAKYYSHPRFEKKDTLLITFSKKQDYFIVTFDYIEPSTFEDLFTVINTKSYVCFVYSDSDISNFFYTIKPFNVDTNLYKCSDYGFQILDWYSDYLFFDGKNFYRKKSN